MSVRRVMSNGIARALVALLSLGVFVVAAQPTATAQDEGPSDEAIAQARDAFREGNHDYVEGRYGEAIRHFEDAHAIAPNPRLIEYIGRCHANLGNYPAAIASYEAFAETSPEAAGEVADTLDGLRTDARTRAGFEAGQEIAEALARARGDQPPPRDIRRQELGTLMQDVSVIIRSEPIGADVYLDAIELGVIGTTPLETPLFVGRHLIEVRHPWYETATRIVNVAPPRRGESIPVYAFLLERRQVPVEVTVDPVTARVSWVGDDGTPRPLGTGAWSGTLPAGQGAFVVQHAGDSRTFDVTLEPESDDADGGEVTAPLTFDLAMVDTIDAPAIRLGTLVVVVDEEDTEIVVDGRVVGTSPGEVVVDLTAGVHSVEVRRDGYASWEREIDVSPDGETRIFPAPLERDRGRGRRGR